MIPNPLFGVPSHGLGGLVVPQIVLLGIGVSVVGIAINALAGLKKER